MRYIFSHAQLQLLYESAKKVLRGYAPPAILRQPIAALESMAKFGVPHE
jgi:hypothetical protein